MGLKSSSIHTNSLFLTQLCLYSWIQVHAGTHSSELEQWCLGAVRLNSKRFSSGVEALFGPIGLEGYHGNGCGINLQIHLQTQ